MLKCTDTEYIVWAKWQITAQHAIVLLDVDTAQGKALIADMYVVDEIGFVLKRVRITTIFKNILGQKYIDIRKGTRIITCNFETAYWFKNTAPAQAYIIHVQN